MNRSIVTDPGTFPTAFEEALNSRDMERLLELFDSQASMRTSDGAVGQGVALIRKELQGLISVDAHITNRLRHILQSQETALILVDWTLDMKTSDGQSVTAQGTATNVLRKTAEHGWRMIISNPQGTA